MTISGVDVAPNNHLAALGNVGNNKHPGPCPRTFDAAFTSSGFYLYEEWPLSPGKFKKVIKPGVGPAGKDELCVYLNQRSKPGGPAVAASHRWKVHT